MNNKEKALIKLEEAPIGVLNEDQMVYLNDAEIVNNMDKNSIDGSAFDLRLSNEAYLVKYTSKIQSKQKVRDLLKESILDAKRIDLQDTILEKNKIYIIRLEEVISFSKFESSSGLFGRASGKSTIGRLDVLTRLLTDFCPKYDEVSPVYNRELFLEVVPISFPIKVAKGMKLHQLRVFKGRPDLSLINDFNREAPFLYYDNNLSVEPRDGILRVSLEPIDNDIISYRSKTNIPGPLDLTIDLKQNSYKISDYWVPIKKENNGLIMEEEMFYILRSKERLLLPNNVAVSCIAYSENLGELRIHYAGFAHPNFGRRRTDDKLGAPLIFEARSHSFGVVIRDNEQFAKIEYYKMSRNSNKTSQYTGQELKLSNYFK